MEQVWRSLFRDYGFLDMVENRAIHVHGHNFFTVEWGYPKASECLLSRILALNIFLHVESAAVTCDEAMEVADDACCRICLVFEPDPRDNEALMLLDIAEEVP
ncbi:hypothetical protein A2U01_0021105, partial [Trifolium medium]|nr:hypothetical protein [Trifolium medium]